MVSQADIAVAIKRLSDAMPPPRGVDPFKAFAAYTDALSKFTMEEINEGISRYLRGECDEKISLKFYPRPPELARIVSGVRSELAINAEKQRRAEVAAQERLEFAEAQAVRQRTPDELLRHDELMRGFHRSHAAAKLDGIGSRGERERREAALRAAETARIREEYGMTDERLAETRDARRLPPGMKQLAAPSLPAPAEPTSAPKRREDDVPFGGLG